MPSPRLCAIRRAGTGTGTGTGTGRALPLRDCRGSPSVRTRAAGPACAAGPPSRSPWWGWLLIALGSAFVLGVAAVVVVVSLVIASSVEDADGDVTQQIAPTNPPGAPDRGGRPRRPDRVPR